MSKRDKCGAKKRNGEPCGRTPGWGTPHPGYGNCKNHGGCTPNGIKAAAREAAGEAVEIYGLPREIDPHQALLEELHRTAGHVSYLATTIRELEGDSQLKQYQVGENGTIERPSVWIELYHAERKHLTSVAATCIKAGIEERRVQLEERQGEMIAQVIREVLKENGVDPNSEPARKSVRKHLSLVA